MNNYQKALKNLNPSQLKAVSETEGPIMVLAGPGTGKTQLLSTRIAYILENSDTLAENILCLTYTDSAVETMRARLYSLIGNEAYKVSIMTYHGFGASVIRDNSFYFEDFLAFEPINNLNSIELIKQIQDELDYPSSLKNKRQLPKINNLINSLKNNLLTPDDLFKIIENDLIFIKEIDNLFEIENDNLIKINKKSITSLEKILKITSEYETNQILSRLKINNLAYYFKYDLKQAVEDFYELNSTKPMTNFKKNWLDKNGQNRLVIKWTKSYKLLSGMVDIYKSYNSSLMEKEMIDYSDMIVQVISKLENNLEFKYSLQEKYQYIMVDEFQDSNEAQNHLVELLVDNPVNENKPNLMIVGDDNQAIYSFQGANYSHMIKFYQKYSDVLVISLSENYRSSQNIINFFDAIANKITDKISDEIPISRKQLVNANPDISKTSIIERVNFSNQISLYGHLISIVKSELSLTSSVAIIAPKHRYLESLLPYLKAKGIEITYERRDDILKDPLIMQLITIIRLICLLSKTEQNESDINQLWSEVLSMPFLEFESEFIVNISIKSHQSRTAWNNLLLAEPKTKKIALFINSLSQKLLFYSADEILDFIIGSKIYNESRYQSNFYDYYFKKVNNFQGYHLLIDNLFVLRREFRRYQKSKHQVLSLVDFINYIDLNIENEQIILSNEPSSNSTNKVELLTAHKAKGREFDTVILLNVNQETWDTSKSNNQNNFNLPPTLNFINYEIDNQNEKLRLFYVALSRAKSKLFLLNSTSDINNSKTSPLTFLEEDFKDNKLFSPLIDDKGQFVKIIESTDNLMHLTDLSYSWYQRHLDELNSDKFRDYIKTLLENFALTPTNFNSYLDLVSAGPDKFLIKHILRFPESQSPALAYGNAIHSTLEWLSNTMAENPSFNNEVLIIEKFNQKLSNQTVAPRLVEKLKERGERALTTFFKDKRDWLIAPSISEYSLNDKGVVLGDVKLKGKIDRININNKEKTIEIIDYKTQRPVTLWKDDANSLIHQHQLYFYQILLKNSTQFKNFQVSSMSILFIDPDEDGKIKELKLIPNPIEMERIIQLLDAVWKQVMALDFNKPDWPSTIAGIRKFEESLLNKNTTL